MDSEPKIRGDSVSSGHFGSKAVNKTPGFKKADRAFTFVDGSEADRSSSSDAGPLRTSANLDSDGEEVRSLLSAGSPQSDPGEAGLKTNQRSSHTQTADALKIVGLHIREVSVQTDIAYHDKRFVSKGKVKSILEDKEE